MSSSRCSALVVGQDAFGCASGRPWASPRSSCSGRPERHVPATVAPFGARDRGAPASCGSSSPARRATWARASSRRSLADPRVTEIVGIARRLPRLEPAAHALGAGRRGHGAADGLFRGRGRRRSTSRGSSSPRATRRRSTRVNVDGLAARVRGGRRGRRAGARPRLLGRRLLARPVRPRGRRVVADRRHRRPPSTRATRRRRSGRSTRSRRRIPELRVVRLRPALIFKREAASGIRRLFAGPLLPSPLVRPALLPVLPLPAGLRVQARARRRRRRRPTGSRRSTSARAAPTTSRPSRCSTPRRSAGRSARARVPRAGAGRPRGRRPDLARAPAADAAGLARHGHGRAGHGHEPHPRRARLGAARTRADAALLELLEGMRDSAGAPTPPLDPRGGRAAAACASCSRASAPHA